MWICLRPSLFCLFVCLFSAQGACWDACRRLWSLWYFKEARQTGWWRWRRDGQHWPHHQNLVIIWLLGICFCGMCVCVCVVSYVWVVFVLKLSIIIIIIVLFICKLCWGCFFSLGKIIWPNLKRYKKTKNKNILTNKGGLHKELQVKQEEKSSLEWVIFLFLSFFLFCCMHWWSCITSGQPFRAAKVNLRKFKWQIVLKSEI